MAQSRPGAVIVGTGFGILTHLRALRAAGFEVVALVGRDPQKTAERAAKAGVPPRPACRMGSRHSPRRWRCPV
jgi:predicted dehydrogenase